MLPISRLPLTLAAGILALSAGDAVAQRMPLPPGGVDASTLGPIPDSPAPGCGMPGRPRDVRIGVFEDAGVSTVELRMVLRHPAVGQLSATLIAPDGTSHVVFGRPGALTPQSCGSTAAADGDYTFADDGANFWDASTSATAVVPDGRFTPGTMGGAAGGGVETQFAVTFSGPRHGRVWTLRLVDWGGGDTGSIEFASLTVMHPLMSGLQPDTYATRRDTLLTVAAPGPMANDGPAGVGSRMYVILDGPKHGSLTDRADGSFAYRPAAGYVGPDSFTYFIFGDGGVGVSHVTILIEGASPPTDLEVASIDDARVILRWQPPAAGASPWQYALTWYSDAMVPLGVIPVAGDVTAIALPAPRGVYYVSLQTRSADDLSPPSAMVRVNNTVTDRPARAAAPAVGVDGDSVTLAWTPTFDGGVPVHSRVEVSGLDAIDVEGDHVRFDHVQAGDYWLSLTAANDGGLVMPGRPVHVTVPQACRPPAVPERLGVFTSPGRLGAVWDPSLDGDAPDGYDADVAGTWTGRLAFGPGRVRDVEAAPGVYTVRIRARNACGVSAWTVAQTVAVP